MPSRFGLTSSSSKRSSLWSIFCRFFRSSCSSTCARYYDTTFMNQSRSRNPYLVELVLAFNILYVFFKFCEAWGIGTPVLNCLSAPQVTNAARTAGHRKRSERVPLEQRLRISLCGVSRIVDNVRNLPRHPELPPLALLKSSLNGLNVVTICIPYALPSAPNLFNRKLWINYFSRLSNTYPIYAHNLATTNN